LRPLAQFLGKAELAEDATTRAAVQRFINADLQHHHTPARAALGDPRLTFAMKALYAPLHFAFSRSGRDDEGAQEKAAVVSQYILDHARHLTTQQAEATALQAASREREAALALIKRSTSWRVTRPLRHLGDMLRKRRSRPG
jgi:hypothetical protein